MADHRYAGEVEAVLGRHLAEVVDRAPDINVRAGPSASWLPEPSVLNIPAGNALCLERVADRREFPQRCVLGLPASSVYEDNDRVRTAAGGQAQLCNLI